MLVLKFDFKANGHNLCGHKKYREHGGDYPMSHHIIDFHNWERKEFYEHFTNEVICTYSTTVNLDITNLKRYRLYPSLIWLLTKAVNQMPEFRTALTDEGVCIYDEMHPAYTIFNKDNKNFSAIWTEFNSDYNIFLRSYELDTAKYSSSVKYAPKPDRPSNSFDISMVPWFTFISFNINVFSDVKYLSFLHFFIARFFEILLISLSSVFFNQKNTIEVRIIVLVKKIQQIL